MSCHGSVVLSSWAVEYSLKRVLLWPFSRATQTDKALTAFFLGCSVLLCLVCEAKVEGFETELCGLGAVMYRDREACG